MSLIYTDRYQSLHFQLDGYIARKVPGQGKMKMIIIWFTLDVILVDIYFSFKTGQFFGPFGWQNIGDNTVF